MLTLKKSPEWIVFKSYGIFKIKTHQRILMDCEQFYESLKCTRAIPETQKIFGINHLNHLIKMQRLLKNLIFIWQRCNTNEISAAKQIWGFKGLTKSHRNIRSDADDKIFQIFYLVRITSNQMNNWKTISGNSNQTEYRGSMAIFLSRWNEYQLVNF